jgi:hypothetical protein
MTIYNKNFRQQFDSSIAEDPLRRAVFNDMCCLANWEGEVDMTYAALSATTRWPIETIVQKVGELLKTDPESRSRREEGARLVPLDPNRAWGWRIVNYAHYRDLRGNEQSKERRIYKRQWMQQFRARQRVDTNVDKRGQRVDTRGQRVEKVDKRGQHVDNTNHNSTPNDNLQMSTVDTRGQPWTGGHHIDIDKDNTTPLPSPQRGDNRPPSSGLLVQDFDEAKKLICEKILNGKNPGRPWSYDAEQALARQLPIPLMEIERVAWFRGLKDDGETPELVARKTVTERGLLMYWSDEVTRANKYWEDIEGWKVRLRKEKEVASD